MKRSRAVFLLIFCVFLWSTSGVLVKLSNWQTIPLNGARSLIAAIVIWAYLRRPHFTWSRAQIGGAIAYVLTVNTFVWATKMTTAANAILLQYTSPLWVALLGIWILGKKPRRLDWGAMGVLMLGILLFFGEQLSITDLFGNLIALFSGVCLALMVLLLRKQKNGSPAETLLLGNLISAVIGVPFLFGQEWSPPQVGIILFLGIVQLGIPFILYAIVIKYLDAIEAILIQMLEPILNPIWVVLLVGERPSPLSMLGGLIVLAAVTGRAIFSIKEAKKSEQQTLAGV
ncbi:MAG: DMT family transporter [Chloroflexi bacterium]|nr:DMT family transporter [Chloroflexota bacterium]